METLQKDETENLFKMKKMREEIDALLTEREHFKEIAHRAEDKLLAREKEIIDV